MGVATETRARREAPVRGKAASTTGDASLQLDGVLAVRPVRQPPREQWCSSLAPGDLACLLAVIEGQVIPRLLSGYAPASASPLD